MWRRGCEEGKIQKNAGEPFKLLLHLIYLEPKKLSIV